MQATAEQSAATGERDARARLLKEAEARAEAAEEVAAELRAALEQQQADFSNRCTQSVAEYCFVPLIGRGLSKLSHKNLHWLLVNRLSGDCVVAIADTTRNWDAGNMKLKPSLPFAPRGCSQCLIKPCLVFDRDSVRSNFGFVLSLASSIGACCSLAGSRGGTADEDPGNTFVSPGCFSFQFRLGITGRTVLHVRLLSCKGAWLKLTPAMRSMFEPSCLLPVSRQAHVLSNESKDPMSSNNEGVVTLHFSYILLRDRLRGNPIS